MTRRDPWLLLILLLPTLVLALPSLERRAHAIHGNDGFLNFAYVRSLLVGGDLDFSDDYADFDVIGQRRGYSFRMTDTPIDPDTGRPVNRYGWGSSLLWSPLVLVAHGVAVALPAVEADGLSEGYFFAVRFGSALWALLGLLALMAVARRRLGGDEASVLWAALALLAATNLGFYIYLHPSMSTAPAFGLAGLTIWQMDRLTERRSAARFFALGLTLAVLCVTRYGDAALVAGLLPAAWAAGRRPRSERTSLEPPQMVPSLLAGVVPIALLQMLIWRALYGSLLSGPAPYLGDDYQWSLPGRHGFAVLFSTDHGWITWHPLVLVGLMGLAVMVRDRSLPLWLRLLPLAVVLQWLAVSAWPVWSGGASFGGRLMATALAVVFLGLVVALRAMARRWGRWSVATVVGLLTLWNLGLMAQYALEMIPRQGSVAVLEVLRNQCHLIGKLVGL
ncbi:glycosyltransferase family 39 protein [Candidatus Sumerlaeota bacterium]|nr:glycosyltransferase family 39 protein [Candidatus Sumerlaeota bacterium]